MEILEFRRGHRDKFSLLESLIMAFLLSFLKLTFFLAQGGLVGTKIQGPPPKEEFKLTFTLGKCLFNLVILTFVSGPLV